MKQLDQWFARLLKLLFCLDTELDDDEVMNIMGVQTIARFAFLPLDPPWEANLPECLKSADILAVMPTAYEDKVDIVRDGLKLWP